MKKSKFDDQFRKEFLANVRPPEGSFEFYEDVLDFNRKKPFYKRNSFVKNLLAICIFIFVVLLTNIVTYTCTINSTFYDNSYEEKLFNYLCDEYDVIEKFEIFNTIFNNDKITIHLLEKSDSKYLIMYNISERLENLEIKSKIDNDEIFFEPFALDNGDVFNVTFFISETFTLDNSKFEIEISDKNTNEILVNFSKNLSLQ